ncbi:uncharacterized protein METZ01_LOCUS487332, partial [marine metagenome]
GRRLRRLGGEALQSGKRRVAARPSTAHVECHLVRLRGGPARRALRNLRRTRDGRERLARAAAGRLAGEDRSGRARGSGFLVRGM